jgi:gamma-glutamylcyclotransferase (GGCT)/AIG2-like uncharacterized protein YtfP
MQAGHAAPASDDYLPIFVYGTLRPGQVNYHRFVHGKTAHEAPAVLPDHAMFVLGRYPCITADAHSGAVIGDLLYLLPELFQEVLAALDQLEEYVPGDPSSPYLRVRRSVRTGDAGEPPHISLAWVYVAGEPALLRRPACQEVSGGDWPAYLAREHR